MTLTKLNQSVHTKCAVLIVSSDVPVADTSSSRCFRPYLNTPRAALMAPVDISKLISASTPEERSAAADAFADAVSKIGVVRSPFSELNFSHHSLNGISNRS